MLSFCLIVVLPLVLTGGYLWGVAKDQYASFVGFTVRQDEAGSATDLMGGLAQFAGVGVSSDPDVLYEFIRSQDIVEKIDAQLGLRDIYSQYWSEDPVFSLWPNADIEDLLWYWGRVVRISFDQSTGLINLRVNAFDPRTAQAVAEAIVEESQKRINELNASARDDMMRYALADLEDTVARLKAAREEMTKFRIRTQIVDPEADFQGRMGVLNTLQQQLAEALIEYDVLLETVQPGDPRLAQAERLIEVIRERIAEERRNFASNQVLEGEADYPTLMAEFEGLMVDQRYAEESYRAALAAVDIARANASRQSRYLAAYIHPTLAQSSEYPKREAIFGLSALFLFMAWSIAVLAYYSLRDRR